MGRPKTYDRDEILERAMQLFWRKGYEATSTSDLEEGMGINRYSLYAEFHSKHDLYQAALERYLSLAVPGFIGGLHAHDAGVAAIEAVLGQFASAAGQPGTERGCMICNAATETAADHADTRQMVQRYVSYLEGGFRNALDGAVRRGELAPHLEAADWAAKLATTVMGLFVLIRARLDGAVARGAARLVLAELRAHAPRRE